MTLQIKALLSLEASGTTHPAKEHHIPGFLNRWDQNRYIKQCYYVDVKLTYVFVTDRSGQACFLSVGLCLCFIGRLGLYGF